MNLNGSVLVTDGACSAVNDRSVTTVSVEQQHRIELVVECCGGDSFQRVEQIVMFQRTSTTERQMVRRVLGPPGGVRSIGTSSLTRTASSFAGINENRISRYGHVVAVLFDASDGND